MEQQFRDDFRSAGNTRERAMLWNAAVLDIVTQAPAQFAREVRQDLRYTLRVYRNRSTTGALAVGALAVAIGASTGIFGVVNAALIRSLPFSIQRAWSRSGAHRRERFEGAPPFWNGNIEVLTCEAPPHSLPPR